jgi:hypothetical protein
LHSPLLSEVVRDRDGGRSSQRGQTAPDKPPDLRRVWLGGLTAAGRLGEVTMHIIACVDSESEGDAREQQVIAWCLRRGYVLVNTNYNRAGQARNRALKAAWRAAQQQ